MATRLTLHMLGGQDLRVVFADDAEAAGVIEQIDNAQQAVDAARSRRVDAGDIVVFARSVGAISVEADHGGPPR